MQETLTFSHMLQRVLDKVEGRTNFRRHDSLFVCLVLKDLFSYHEECYSLIDWIESHISSPKSDGHGVVAWLVHKGYVEHMEMINNYYSKEFYDYRILWIKDMIAYWKSNGQ